MKKGAVAVLVVMAALLASSAVYADWGWGGGWCMTGNDPGMSTQKMRSFQKDTLKLRESLMDKRLDLQEEFSKEVPDGKRLAVLRKEIVQIQSQLQAAGEKHGMSNWGMGGNMGMDGNMGQRQMGAGGCGCGGCGW